MSTASESRMKSYVTSFLGAKTYTERHAIVMLMSLIEDKENISINLPAPKIARFFIKMQAFGFAHGKNDPNCTCMDG